MEKRPPSLCARLESAIGLFLYNDPTGRARAWAMGLQVPLWFWTHQITVESEREARELQKAVNIVRWFYDNGVNMTQVAIVVPSEMKPRMRAELLTTLQENMDETERCVAPEELPLPAVLAPHELTAMNTRDNVVHQYEVILYVFALPPVKSSLLAAKQQEQFLGDAIAAAKGAFILIADVGWTSSHITVNWPQWKTFVMKFEEEMPLVSSACTGKLLSDARFPSLVGARIPLCCPRHVDQRQVEHGIAPIARSCKRLCLQPFSCQREGHVCLESCHPRVSHVSCSYACQSVMPCGHECMQSCSDRCNCFGIIERPLSCSHMTVIGVDQDTMQPIYARVRHVFKGYCVDANLPCVAEYVTECVRCLGPLTTTCSEATQNKHTLEHKTMLCPGCVRFEREVRAKILGEILVQTEEAKRRMKVEMQRCLHQQRKASSQGLFQEGSRVTICDVTKIVKPLCADADFPGVEFVDYDAPDFYSNMEDAYGTFVSRHVDIDDLSEVRNLIRLRSGEHVLVADGGVRLIRALTSAVTQQVPRLLLTCNGNSTLSDGKSLLENGADFEKAAKMIGRTYYLAVPVACGENTISDKIVCVTAVDPVSPESVLVDCRLTSVSQHADEVHAEENGVSSKRPRLEGTRPQTRMLCTSVETLTFTAPIAALEPMEGYVPGREVLVLDPARQVTNPHDVEAFEAVLTQTPGLDLRDPKVSTAPVARDTPFTLLGVVNSPLHLEKRYGPCAVLRRHVRLVTVRSGRRGRNSNGCSSVQHVLSNNGGAEDSVVVLVPFVFTAADELLEAENTLDAAALEKFEQRVCETISKKSEELAIRNDEEAFHQQRQMPEVTEEVLSQDRFDFSCPIPLPTTDYLAGVRTRHARLLCASSTTLRLSRQKDALALKQQQLGLSKWLEAVRLLYAQDREADKAYCRGLQLKAASEK